MKNHGTCLASGTTDNQRRANHTKKKFHSWKSETETVAAASEREREKRGKNIKTDFGDLSRIYGFNFFLLSFNFAIVSSMDEGKQKKGIK